MIYASPTWCRTSNASPTMWWFWMTAGSRPGPDRNLKAEILQAEAVFEQPIVEFSSIPGQIDRQVDGRVATITAWANEEDLTRALKEAGAASIQIGRLSLEDILVACLRGGKEMPRV